MIEGLTFVIRSLIVLGAVGTVIALVLLALLWQEKHRNAFERARREALRTHQKTAERRSARR